MVTFFFSRLYGYVSFDTIPRRTDMVEIGILSLCLTFFFPFSHGLLESLYAGSLLHPLCSIRRDAELGAPILSVFSSQSFSRCTGLSLIPAPNPLFVTVRLPRSPECDISRHRLSFQTLFQPFFPAPALGLPFCVPRKLIFRTGPRCLSSPVSNCLSLSPKRMRIFCRVMQMTRGSCLVFEAICSRVLFFFFNLLSPVKQPPRDG